MRLRNHISLNVLLLGLVSLINDLSSEMILPILPLFIASLGGSGVAIGLIGGARDSITSLLKVFSGYLSDRTDKKKKLIFSGYLLSSVFKILLAFSKTWHHALIFIGFERIGKGLRDAPRDTIIAQSMPHRKGRAFGIHRAFDTTGAIIGSIVSLVLFWGFGFSFRTIILLSATIAFSSLIPIKWVTEKKQQKKHLISFKKTLFNLPNKLKLFLIITALFSLANFSYMFFILRAQKLFGNGPKTAIPILLYILFNIFYAGLAIPFGNLADKIGRKKVLSVGYFLFIVTTIGFAYAQSLIAYIVLFALYGTVKSIVDANQRALTSELSGENAHGTSLGAYHTVNGLFALPASIIAGALWQISPESTFLYGAAMSGITAVLFTFTRKWYGE